MQSLSQAKAGDDKDAIVAGIAALSKGSDDFASRRMDKAISSALTGKSINSLSE
jgi:molecular chaperone HscA